MTRGKILLLLTTALCIGLATFIFVIAQKKDDVPFSKELRQTVTFPLYYPNKLPADYVLDTRSVEYKNSILFTQFRNGDQTIFLSQQDVSQNPPHLESLKGFSSFSTPIGKAFTGEQAGTTAVLIATNKSLITITGGEIVGRDVLGIVAEKLRPVSE